VASKIFTEAKVTKIDHRSIPVKVTYKNSQGNFVTVRAKKVLVTVPLGVLQQGSINFVPSLPFKKRKAINKIGMGLMNKVILLWSGPSDVFWPTSTEWFADLTNRNTNMEFFNPYMYNGGKPLLVGFVSGREAKDLEDQFGNDEAAYKSEMKNIALVALRNMFGSGNVPEPDDVIVTKWGKDPYSYGSYSYNKLGVYRTSRSTLSATVNNRLFFGGEATHPKYFATVHGALLSGNTAGTRIWNSLRRKRKRRNAK
jgi:monoamine oxidase